MRGRPGEGRGRDPGPRARPPPPANAATRRRAGDPHLGPSKPSTPPRVTWQPHGGGQNGHTPNARRPGLRIRRPSCKLQRPKIPRDHLDQAPPTPRQSISVSWQLSEPRHPQTQWVLQGGQGLTVSLTWVRLPTPHLTVTMGPCPLTSLSPSFLICNDQQQLTLWSATCQGPFQAFESSKWLDERVPI